MANDGQTPASESVNDADGWAELEAGLRETWPELESVDAQDWPRSREETVDLIARMTGASIDEIQRRLDGLAGRVEYRPDS